MRLIATSGASTVSALVTVCIATRNRASRLPRAIESVLSQSHSSIELFIVDDASTDETANVIHRAARRDPRVTAHSFAQNKGLASARNHAICHGTGTYFTFLDDDDLWDTGFIAECVRVAESMPDVACFTTGFCVDSSVGGRQCYASDRQGPLRAFIEAGYTPPVASQFYRREAITAVDGYTERIRSGVDHDLWLKLGAHDASLSMIPKILAFPDTNLSDGTRMTTNFVRRRERIAASLEIWRPLLDQHYTPGFTGHFTRCYEYAISRKEIAAHVASGERLAAVRVAFGSPFKMQLLRFVLRKFGSTALSNAATLPIGPSFPTYSRSATSLSRK